MSKPLAIWKFINHSLQRDIAVMLLYVLESSGSSPGRQGFFMAVNANNEMEGSIGGGIMEHKFVEMALAAFAKASAAEGQVKKQIHDKAAAKDQSGMICSGEQTIFLYPVQSSDTTTIQSLIASLEKNNNGTLQLSPSGISFQPDIPEQDFYFSLRNETDWEYKEKTGYKNQLSIIGGGHCALALSQLAAGMDFYIKIYDDRQELNTIMKNDFVHEKILVQDYSELANLVGSGKNHYVVIMTMGYRTDDIAVRALLGKTFTYLGLLGSRTKIQKMMDAYKKEGLNSSYLQRIHAPIGLDIKSETPEEIAVSVMGEIISVKNFRSGR
ncbi:MAG TPA: XdhC family protein [Chitinophagaceae bacterium]|jgi:xanthine dehydrogenase accessory factor|nr:XdhC family protein [Chitinophagaceae bacterium]